MTDYDMPMPERIKWMEGVLAYMVDENASWAVPRAETIYGMSKKTKNFARDFGDGDPAFEEVLLEMGWTMES